MSGFVAVISRRGAWVNGSLLERLAAPLASHGPHGSGSHRDGPAGLAHALFVTRENASVGPHRSSRGAWLVGDIRLDAQAELRDALAAAGSADPTGDDDEALVHAAYQAWGEDAVSRLRGDFSFALWDPRLGVLLCARDAFGVRPLYYAETGDAFVCSNLLAAVRAHPAVSARLHEPAIVSFLQWGFNVDLTRTTFADVHRLAPAHQLRVTGDAVGVPRRYWSFPVPARLVYRRDEEYVEHYRAVLGEAVRDRIRVPRLGILMSGGLDSTSLSATVRHVSPHTELVAYTTEVSSLVQNDDVTLARAVAERLGIRHEIVEDVSPALEHLTDAGFRSPEPLDEPEHAAWSRLAGRMSKASPVAFMGEDADALFRPPSLLAMLRNWPARDVLARAVRFTLAHGRHPHLGINLRKRIADFRTPAAASAPAWLRRDVLLRTGIPSEARVPAHPARPETQRFLLGSLWQSLHESCDTAYTGAALELRWPFLDIRVLEFALAIPPIPWCQRKELARVAFRGELPARVIARPKTTLPGYYEAQVKRWRAGRGGPGIEFGPVTREFVDSSRVLDNLQRGGSDDVVAAWRVLELDRWLRAG